MNIADDRNLAVYMYRGQIEEHLTAHAAVLRRWLDALRRQWADAD